ncbi:LysR family transcriptional regulator [Paroceanicella profunda]|uniref:HTH-type transcriptional regulator MetR n=1 Tax=Paroceanicella profunda TaxID=2579971 RepID=A0A5B8FTM6_9RHOB|nr:LysR family transcriptional regulator [Paroceanicella profunda]QDL91725.1 LysR family transcriptional regulator [Paroceanicella profunda]
MIDLRHLRCLRAIHEKGSLARAADTLCVTQSALSHQIKGLEALLGLDLYMRNSRPLRLTAAGAKVLEAAQRLLPEIEALEEDLTRMAGGQSGRMLIAIECHACFEWLLPVLEGFRSRWPEVEIDIRVGLSFEAIPALQRGLVDLVISSDPVEAGDVMFAPLFGYEGLLVAAPGHPLATKPLIEPEDFRDQTLITYPVERGRLDVFTGFLGPAGVEPADVRPVELTAVILLLVASGKGVSVLPDWVLRAAARDTNLARRSLGTQGLHRTLFAAHRTEEAGRAYLADFIAAAREWNGGRAD